MAKNQEKKPIKLCCDRCRHPGFKIRPWYEDNPFKPEFVCDKCGNVWCWGRDGGEYVHQVINKEIVAETLAKYKEANDG